MRTPVVYVMLYGLMEINEPQKDFRSKDDVELLLNYSYDDCELTKTSPSWNEYNGFKIYLKQISSYPPLNREQEQHLFKIFAKGSPREKFEARDIVILSNQWLIISVARKFRGRGLDFEDLVQEGNLGLIVAVEKFDYTKGFKFSTYAIHWIKQAIRRALYQQKYTVRRSEYLYKQAKALLRTRNEIRKFIGYEPTISELTEATGMSREKIEQLYFLTQIEISLDETIGDSDDNSNTIGDLIPDDKIATPAEIVSEKVFNEQLAQLIDKSLEHLKPVEVDVIRRRFGIGYDNQQTLKTVGKVHGISRERVRQIESKAIKELRHPSKGISHPTKSNPRLRLRAKVDLDEPEDEVVEVKRKLEQSKSGTTNSEPRKRCMICHSKMPSDAWKYCSDLCRRKLIYERGEISGSYIRQRREAIGLYQQKLADKIGVHVSTLQLWEANKEKPTFDNFNKLLDLFDKHRQQIRDSLNQQITGEYIKKQRKVYGLIQQDLADLLGLTKETISNWERDIYAPDLRNQQRLRELFAKIAKTKREG